MNKKKNENTHEKSKYISVGIPMSKKSYDEWKKAFEDMEECFKNLKKNNNFS